MCESGFLCNGFLVCQNNKRGVDHHGNHNADQLCDHCADAAAGGQPCTDDRGRSPRHSIQCYTCKADLGSKVANGAVDQRGDDEGQNQIGIQHDGQTKGHALVDLKDAGANAQFGDGTIICTLGEQEDRNDQTQSTTGATQRHIGVPEAHVDDVVLAHVGHGRP